MNNLEIVYDTNWQVIRISLLGNFTDLEVYKNITILKDYIDTSNNKNDELTRIWRVINLLNAVRMGINGTKRVDSYCDKAIKQFRNELQARYKVLLSEGAVLLKLDWRETENQLKDLYNKNILVFNKIFKSLSNRKKSTMKKVGTLSNRNELIRYINIMEEIR